MEDGTTARIKQEIDSCCSPSPTSSNNVVSIITFGSNGQEPVSTLDSHDRAQTAQSLLQMDFKCGPDTLLHSSEQQSPGSPDRQFCSSTTSAIGDFGSEAVPENVKEELPR
jgi:hypothetical protein